MAVSPDLLELLCCPENHMRVRVADQDLVARLNAAIAAGKVKNRGGQPVTEAVESALVREDGKVLYPVRDDIASMLVEEGIDIDF